MGNNLGCRIIDSGRKPDRNNPFLRNNQMLTDIKSFKCTEYERDAVTNQITAKSWSNPLSIADTDEFKSDKSTNSSGLLIPQNICFENAEVFGLNGDKSWQNSFTKDFCSNITPSSDVDFFKFPQDLNFRDFVFGVNPNNSNLSNRSPEWGLSKDAVAAQITYNIVRDVLIQEGISYKIRRFFKKKKPKDEGDDEGEDEDEGEAGEAGEGTVETEEGIEMTDFATLEEVSEEAGQEAAETVVAASTDAATAEGVETAAVSAAGDAVVEDASTEGTIMAAGAETGPFDLVIGAVAALGIIASSFAQDLADSTCGYDDMNKPTLVYQDQKGHPKAACCRSSCAVAGAMTLCTRMGGLGFNASFFQCCLQDFECQKNKTTNTGFTVSSDQIGTNTFDLCFQEIDAKDTDNNLPKIATCHPDARNLSSQICSSVVGAYCIGQSPFGKNQSSLLDAWSATGVIDFENDNGIKFSVKAPCLNLVARLLTGNTNYSDKICSWDDFIAEQLFLSPEILDPVGLTIVQDILETFLNEYLVTHGTPIGKIDANGYIESSDFLTWFLNLCKKYPFLCQVPLTNFCSGLTPDELLTKPETIQWCGCYLEDKYYEDYDKFGIEKQCSPLCNRVNNIPLIGDDGVPINCTDTICMIDDLSIKLAQTFTDGPIEFNQVCNTCGGSKVVKKYSSFYQSLENDNLTKFFELAPLTKDDYNNSFIKKNTFSTDTNIVGYEELTSGETYSISENTNYKIVKESNTSLNFTVQFNLGVPLVIPGTNKILYYIASLTADTITNLENNDQFINNLDPDNPANNIFYITLSNGNSPLSNGKFFFLRINYYKAGETKTNGDDTISQSYIQSIVTDVSQFNVGVLDKSCSCVVNGNLNFVDEQATNLDFNNNCGNTTCYNDSGDRIPCGTDTDDISNTSNITNNIIATTSDNIDGFNLLTDNQKTEFLSTSTISLFTVVVIANFFLIKYPKKYRIILISFFFLLLFTIIIMYLIYSNSFGIDNFINIF